MPSRNSNPRIDNPDLATRGGDEKAVWKTAWNANWTNAAHERPADLFRFRKKPPLCVGRYPEDANNKTVTVVTSTEIVIGQRGRFDRGILTLRRRVGLALRFRASKIPRYK
jgi:hypothetical protein